MLRKGLKNVLKNFNDAECGGCYIYLLRRDELIQLDMYDYSTCIICVVEDIESYTVTKDGLYLEMKDEELDGCWIDEMGCQF
ncbi:hypothetical protein N493_07325 [Clostridium botulinum B2 433]|uniref:hypothetical protein n=1 Tax=Clostridium botulinum TaxID=1491 RepID=UPI0007E01A54|nr:hypothetical protein [Clostridium botulinum]KEI89314.1 hypothetical protein N493_07325 [Clostridium botulinum B2 433]